MYAVFQTGGKQYKVSQGDIINVELLKQKVGDEVNLSEVLFVSDGSKIHVGKPYLEGASVKAKVVKEFRGEKVLIFKRRRRKHYKRKNGHRQDLMSLEIQAIEFKKS